MKRSVLFVTHATTVGGGERSMLELAAALGAERHDVSFALPGPGPLAAALAKTRSRTHFYRAERSLLAFRRERISLFAGAWWRQTTAVWRAARSLRRVVAAEQPDVVHTHSQKAHVFGTLAAFGAGVPVVWHMRDILSGRFARRFMDVLALAGATRVVAISRAAARPFRLARGKVAVVYNGVAAPEPLTLDGAGRLKRSWGIAREARVVGCVGQIAPWKGHRVFVEAAAALAPAFPDLYFVIVGSPLYGAHAYRAELVRRVKRAGLAPRFRFLGQLEDAARAVGAFDVLVHLPVAPEPFGRVVAEAMARAVPVVASRSGGLKEIMEDGREGFLVEAANAGAAAAAIAFVLDDPPLAAEMGVRGCETYWERFTVQRLCREVERIYDLVLRGRRGRPGRHGEARAPVERRAGPPPREASAPGRRAPEDSCREEYAKAG